MATTIEKPATSEPTTDAPGTSLPPGPPLPKPIQTALLWTITRPYLFACRRRYGHTFSVRTVEMGTLVYISREEDLKAVFTGDPEVFHAGEGNSLLGPVMGERSVLLLDEDEHLQQRKRMLPPFHGESVKRYRDVVREIAAAEVERWPIDEPFPVHPRANDIALEVILRAVIGVEEAARLDRLRTLLRGVLDFNLPVMLMWLWPALGRLGPGKRYVEPNCLPKKLKFLRLRWIGQHFHSSHRTQLLRDRARVLEIARHEGKPAA